MISVQKIVCLYIIGLSEKANHPLYYLSLQRDWHFHVHNLLL
jgi:hypothetical protein